MSTHRGLRAGAACADLVAVSRLGAARAARASSRLSGGADGARGRAAWPSGSVMPVNPPGYRLGSANLVHPS
jgi:hypothetical protein